LQSVTRDAASIAHAVLRVLLRWHPVYIYMSRGDRRPYVPFLHQSLLLHDNLLRHPVRVLVGDEVGLGKTAEAALTLRGIEERLRRSRRDGPRFLILVPRILLEQWVDELGRVGAGEVRVLRSSLDVERWSRQGWPPGYYVGSIQLLRLKRNADHVAGASWDVVVVDEAHNVGIGPSFRSPTRSYLLVHRLTRDPERSVLLLTATPHRGKARDYLARLLLLVPELGLYDIEKAAKVLDDPEFYRSTHEVLVYRRTKELVNALEGREVFKPAYMKAVVVKAGSDERQFEQILTGFLRRKIEEWGSDIWSQGNPKGLLLALIRKRASSSVYAARRTLEAIIRGLAVRSQRAAPEELRVLSQALSASFDELEEEPEEVIEKALQALPAGLFGEKDRDDLRVLVELARRIEERGESKLEALKSLLEKWVVNEGRRVVVFSEYRDTVEYLYTRLAAATVGGRRLRLVCVSGAPSGPCAGGDEKVKSVKSMLEVGDVDVVLATDVASEGLNLQAASVLVNYDVPWSPVKLEQRIGRVWRLGQREDVHVYSLFRDTYADLALVDKLYMKILAIKRAMGTARAMIGSRAEIYAEGEMLSVDSLYRGGVPGASGAVADALGDAGELEVARAMIEGRLGEVAEKILERINRLRYELESKNVYPGRHDPSHLRGRAARYLGLGRDRGLGESILRQAARLRRLTGGVPPRDLQDAVSAFRSVLARVSRAGVARGRYRSPAVEGTLALVPVKVVDGAGVVVYEEVVGVDLGRSSIVAGLELVDKVIDILEAGAERVDTRHGLKRIDELRVTAKAKRVIAERLGEVENRIRVLNTVLKARGVAAGLDAGKLTVVADRDSIVVIERGEVSPRAARIEEALGEQGEAAKQGGDSPVAVEVEEPGSVEERLRLERRALQLVMRYELDQGRLPRDVHEERSYDIESRDPETNEVLRYIEVKAHAGYSGLIELTEREYEFARSHRDKYWLYLVVGMATPEPRIITIHDPLSKLDLKPVRKKKVEERLETRYVAELNLSHYS